MENEYQLVSIDEMREMLYDKAYIGVIGETELRDGLIGGGFGAEFICWWRPNLLRDHLLVEECMSRDDINWQYTTHAYDYRTIAYIRYLWYNPLVWIPIPEDITKKYFVSGRMAEERFIERLDPVNYDTPKNNPINPMIHTKMLDWFAEKLPILDWNANIDIFEEKDLLYDICFWKYLTTDDRPLMSSIRDGGKFDLSLVQLFSPSIFLENIKTIAERQGKTRAAEIVRLFRKDWQRIVAMKFFDIDKISKDQVEDFRACLFEGMDYYLEQWEAETVPQNETKDKTACFPLITEQCRKEGKVDSVDTEIRAACRGTAVGLWKTLRTNAALDYIEPLETWNAAELYRTIEHYYGELPFKERNFREARNKK